MPTDVAARPVLFPDTVITGELLEALRLPPDVARTELIDGTLYAMTPQNRWHGAMLAHLTHLLTSSSPRGWRLLAGDVGLYLRRRPDTVRGPDLMAISEARWAATDPARSFLTVLPELLIEINSPSNDDEDTGAKVQAYLVADPSVTVWVVDLDARTVTRWTATDSTLHGLLRDELVPVLVDDPLPLPWGGTLAIEDIFAAA